MIKLADKTIDQKDYKVLIKFLQNESYLNQSKENKKFENKFSKKLKTKNSIFVNSGSSANLLMAQTLIEGNFIKNKIVVLLQFLGQLPSAHLYNLVIKCYL